MRITVTMSGGWGGLRQRRVIETREMRAEDAARLEMLTAALIERSETLGARVRDARTYRIELDGAQGSAATSVNEASSSVEVQELLELLRTGCPALR